MGCGPPRHDSSGLLYFKAPGPALAPRAAIIANASPPMADAAPTVHAGLRRQELACCWRITARRCRRARRRGTGRGLERLAPRIRLSSRRPRTSRPLAQRRHAPPLDACPRCLEIVLPGRGAGLRAVAAAVPIACPTCIRWCGELATTPVVDAIARRTGTAQRPRRRPTRRLVDWVTRASPLRFGRCLVPFRFPPSPGLAAASALPRPPASRRLSRAGCATDYNRAAFRMRRWMFRTLIRVVSTGRRAARSRGRMRYPTSDVMLRRHGLR